MDMTNWSDWSFNGPPRGSYLDETESALGRKLPSDYVRFMREIDGGTGFISDNYLILWKAEELLTFNREYEIEMYAPGLFLFGSSGGGEGFAFDMRDEKMGVVMVPFIGMSLTDAKPIAPGFDDFLRYLEG